MLHEIFSASPSFPTAVAWGNGMVLGAVGLVNLIAPLPVRVAYARWDINPVSYFVVGVLQLLAATFLFVPEWRIWGISLAALIAFGAVVLLLDRGRYAFALPVVLFMVALGAAVFSVPPSHAPIHYIASLPTAAHSFS